MQKDPSRSSSVDKLIAIAFDDIQKLQLLLNVVSSDNPDLVKGLGKSWGLDLSDDDVSHVLKTYQAQKTKPLNIAYT
jgi:hypothetical protein